MPADLHYDPYDYDTDRNPHPVWKRLRDEAPLYFNEQHGFYALSRYEDVLDGLLDWETYSSARGTVLEIIQPGPPAESPSPMVGNLGSMIFSDPPEPRHRPPHREPLVHPPQGRAARRRGSGGSAGSRSTPSTGGRSSTSSASSRPGSRR